jgi:hypothetical protein
VLEHEEHGKILREERTRAYSESEHTFKYGDECLVSRHTFARDDKYEHIRCEHRTETSIVYLDRYISRHEYPLNPFAPGNFERFNWNFLWNDGGKDGDRSLWTTKIGRKNCTFRHRGWGHEENEIFEIVGSRVKIIGYIVYKNARKGLVESDNDYFESVICGRNILLP